MIPHATLATHTTSYISYPERDDGQIIVVICLVIVIFTGAESVVDVKCISIEVSAPSYEELWHEIMGDICIFLVAMWKKETLQKI